MSNLSLRSGRYLSTVKRSSDRGSVDGFVEISSLRGRRSKGKGKGIWAIEISDLSFAVGANAF